MLQLLKFIIIVQWAFKAVYILSKSLETARN